MSLIDQNRCVPCPKTPEESWRRTDPEIFFLSPSEILNYQGLSAQENQNKLLPWKVCFRDFNKVTEILSQVKQYLGQDAIEKIEQEKKRLVVISVVHGLADVYMSENMKTHIEFMSAPWDVNSIVQNSAIAAALSLRLRFSSPHKIKITVSEKDHEIPLFLILNHCEPNFAQSYNFIHLCLKKNTKAELIYLDGGSAFSLSRHHLELEKNARLSEFWLNTKQKDKSNTAYLERSVTLAEGAKFTDAQLFLMNTQTRIISNIEFLGIKAMAQSGGVVLGSQGKFDYEPIQEHKVSHGFSRLNLKMILAKKARATFQGLVVAHKEAQKCEALQVNKNILLSKTARVDSLPRLEILPNDIVCKHGSATAELDSKQLFYLQSRGFSLADSRKLILKSFALSSYSFLEGDELIQDVVESAFEKTFFEAFIHDLV